MHNRNEIDREILNRNDKLVKFLYTQDFLSGFMCVSVSWKKTVQKKGEIIMEAYRFHLPREDTVKILREIFKKLTFRGKIAYILKYGTGLWH